MLQTIVFHSNLPVIATNCWGDELTKLFEFVVGGMASDGVSVLLGAVDWVAPDDAYNLSDFSEIQKIAEQTVICEATASKS